MMQEPVLGYWEVLAPPGLTDQGRIRAFQERTISRLQALTEEYTERSFQQLRAAVAATYREGEGTTLGSLRKNVRRTSTGVAVQFTAHSRSLVYLTALAGLPYASPGHLIPQTGVSKFYWRNPLHGMRPGIYTFSSRRPAFWHTRRGVDVMSDVLGAGAAQYGQAMIAEHNRAFVNFVQNDLGNVSRSPRVHVTAAG